LRDKAASAVDRVSRSINPRWHGLCASLGLIAVATTTLLAVGATFDIPHLVFAYLLPVIYVAIKFGRVQALIATAVSGFCAAFFLNEPLLTIYIEDRLDLADMALFGVSALLISQFFGKRFDYSVIGAR
jgi:K+-sensing histidine kinase KdpD